jgi:hypothetical protein
MVGGLLFDHKYERIVKEQGISTDSDRITDKKIMWRFD